MHRRLKERKLVEASMSVSSWSLFEEGPKSGREKRKSKSYSRRKLVIILRLLLLCCYMEEVEAER